MKYINQLILFLTLLSLANYSQGQDNRVEFKLTFSPIEWTLPKDDKNQSPVLLIWCMKNKTDDSIIVPIGTPTKVELVDANNKNVQSFPVISNASTKISELEYIKINRGFSQFTLGGLDANLINDKSKLYFGGFSTHGGFYFGPLVPGKYRLRCTFSTEMDPTDYAKKLMEHKIPVWFGEFSSEWIDITVK